VTGDNAKAARELAIDPAEKISRCETLRRFGMSALLLQGDDVDRQMHIDSDFEQRLELKRNLSLSCSSNSRKKGVVIHMCRQCGTRVRPCLPSCFLTRRWSQRGWARSVCRESSVVLVFLVRVAQLLSVRRLMRCLTSLESADWLRMHGIDGLSNDSTPTVFG